MNSKSTNPTSPDPVESPTGDGLTGDNVDANGAETPVEWLGRRAIWGLFLLVFFFIGPFFLGDNIYSPDQSRRMFLIYLFVFGLTVLYFGVWFASYIYMMRLKEVHEAAYKRFQNEMHSVPRFFSTWILPIISILLVVVTQLVLLAFDPIPIEIEIGDATFSTYRDIYSLVYTFSVSAVLIMIGMELSYYAQRHPAEHRWSVLVTVSMILDFVAYIILVLCLNDLIIHVHPNEPSLEVPVSLQTVTFALMLGLASLGSSYFTITQARIWNEIIASTVQGRS